MKVLHTIAGTRFDHGGPSRSVPSLCEAIGKHNIDVHFLTTHPADDAVAYNLPRSPVRSHLIKESRRFGRLTLGRTYQKVLRELQSGELRFEESANSGILIHDHGLWLTPNHAVAVFARKNGICRIVSPRGMLSSWAINHGRWKKRLAWWAYQQADLRSATAFHVTSKLEADEVRELGFKQPIAIIPNGVLFPDLRNVKKFNTGRRRMLFLSRIHPKKGLLELVHAWKLASVDCDWDLVIAGTNEDGYQKRIEDEVCKLDLTDRVQFPGSIPDSDKWDMYANADLFVLPSFSENFGIVVAEALAAGLPVITTTGTPWNELPAHQCGWWVNPTTNDLAKTIAVATKLSPNRLNTMGINGATWVRNSFSWETLGINMIQFYGWLLGKSERPGFVDVNEADAHP